MGRTRAMTVTKLAAGLVAALALSACSMAGLPKFAPIKTTPKPVEVAATDPAPTTTEAVPYEPLAFAQTPKKIASLDGLISKYSAQYDVPESLVRRVIQRESGYNPGARNGPNLGLMQIQYATARSMGYTGPASGLFDAETNLRYAVKYLKGAYIVGDRNHDQAVRNYSRGYYYDAKRKGLLDKAGLR
jgi:soluble lytic murein transglycosylase-like protein